MANALDEGSDERLEAFTGFGSNPGDLLARAYIPAGLSAGAPLVVVLHGCTQSAGGYNRGAGWTSAADEHGFALLFPEQQRSNNANLCFNWFSAADARRGRGEALSIVQMVQDLCARRALNNRRVYITGLSAGGAMTAAMLATYPDVFAGGAVIAGLPFGTATSVPEAFERMRGQAEVGPDRLAGLVRSASNHAGKWPILSVWHGGSDRTVDSSNAAALVEQWRSLHGLATVPGGTDLIAGHPRRVWCDDNGVEVIEEFMIKGMGHGTPIHAVPANDGENAGPYMLDVGISSTRRIVAFWGLERKGDPLRAVSRGTSFTLQEVTSGTILAGEPSIPPPSKHPNRAQDVIERALRSAGLMR